MDVAACQEYKIIKNITKQNNFKGIFYIKKYNLYSVAE